MAKLIFIILLLGQFIWAYVKLLDIKFKKMKVTYWIVVGLIELATILIGIIYNFGPTKISLLAGLFLLPAFNGEKRTNIGLYYPIFGLCISLNTVWGLLSYYFALEMHYRIFACVSPTWGLIILAYFLKKKKDFLWNDLNFTNVELIIINIFTAFIAISMGAVANIQSGNNGAYIITIYIVFTTILCSVIYLLTIYSIFLNRKIQNEEKKLLYQKVTLEAQKEQVDAILESEKKYHKYRHDLAAHLNAIHHMAEKSRIDELKEYCETLLDNAKPINNTAISGNVAVDGILRSYKDKCEENGIGLQMQVQLLGKNKVQDYDLCIIFSNILSNAIEACKKGDSIRLVSYPYNNSLCIMANNPTNHEIMINNGEIKTTKNDKTYHGHGLSNIKAVVNKYNGILNIKAQNGMFNIEILI
ncbi:GHKL domain-containing protein [Pseudobutyrivibrio sp. NOR37]|uniref:Sensor histidine kinase n=1 Tax=Pseudobutyrivibrio xylanivorans TaxID=185007 RepID=A0A6M0LHV7_PSEXY|nr:MULTISPECIES: ATP-binding protein [Pseudobutyrivibrio]NEX01467.1 sensor histidine kinase [Pseudobutyrivibrio xylanivorans]SFR67718.1 GHKL domain-containing protein [Pseudobutyrivibrio sp. NOR37]